MLGKRRGHPLGQDRPFMPGMMTSVISSSGAGLSDGSARSASAPLANA